jgi:hypothetical protein
VFAFGLKDDHAHIRQSIDTPKGVTDLMEEGDVHSVEALWTGDSHPHYLTLVQLFEL